MKKKLAENEAKAYKEKLELIFNTTKDIVVLLDVENENRYRILTVNQPFLEAIGLKKDQVEGRLIEEVIPPSSLALVLQKYKEAIETRKSVRWDETTEYASGIKTGIVTISPIFDESGRCINLLGTSHDITQRKKSEREIRIAYEEVRHKNEELQAKNTRLQEIAWVQSHKVRAPLARIMGLVDLIINRYTDEKERDSLLNHILNSAHELDSVIKEIVNKTEES